MRPTLSAALLSSLLAALAACDADAIEAPDEVPATATGSEGADTRRTVINRIQEWNAGLSAADRDAKYCKMAVSPFTFFRGTNHLYWEDTWLEPRLDALSSDQTQVWLQGDMHAANIGAFDNDDGDVVYDLNDFDETLIGDYQRDLWRMGASLVLVADGNGNVTPVELATVLETFVTAYLDAMIAYAPNDDEDAIAFTADTLPEPLRTFVLDVEARNDRLEALDDWTVMVDGDRVLDTALPELEALTDAETATIVAAIDGYGATLTGGLAFDPAYFAAKSVARRLLAGTGSLGTPRYYLLVEGPSADPDDDRILDIKRQGLPTALQLAPAAERDRYDALFSDHAARHALAYRALANDVDDHLGAMRLPDGDYSVRERSVFKKSLDLSALTSADLLAAAAAWGTILATAHARADVDFDPALIGHSVDLAIATDVAPRATELTATITDLALAYGERATLDWERFSRELAPTTCAP